MNFLNTEVIVIHEYDCCPAGVIGTVIGYSDDQAVIKVDKFKTLMSLGFQQATAFFNYLHGCNGFFSSAIGYFVGVSHLRLHLPQEPDDLQNWV